MQGDYSSNLIQTSGIRDTGSPIQTSDLTPEALWQQAYDFVETEKKKIIGFARHFLPYSSYGHDEFIQQAYESAFKGFKKCLEKGDPGKYKGYFWRQYLKDCYDMANIPSRKKFYEESIKTSIKDPILAKEVIEELSRSPITHEEYREYSEDDAPATAVASSIPDPLQTAIRNEETLDNELKELIQEVTVKKALKLMTQRERQVWDHLLGCRGKIYDIKDLTTVLGLKKQRIIELRENALSFIQKVFDLHGQKLYTLQELSEKSGYSIGTLKLMKMYGFLKANEDYIQRTKSSSALFTEKAINKLIARREGKIREEAPTMEEIKKSKKFRKQKLYTLQELSEKTGYSLSTLRAMRCYGFFESGREVIKALYQRAGVALPIDQDDLALSCVALSCASGASTAAKNVSGTVLYLFTEKAVKKLILRRKRTMATKKTTILLPKPVFIRQESINIDSVNLPAARYEPVGYIPAHILLNTGRLTAVGGYTK